MQSSWKPFFHAILPTDILLLQSNYSRSVEKAINKTASATCRTSMRASTFFVPSACGTPAALGIQPIRNSVDWFQVARLQERLCYGPNPR
jgi:hypothetical protein